MRVRFACCERRKVLHPEAMREATELMAALDTFITRAERMTTAGDDQGGEREAFLDVLGPGGELLQMLGEWLDELDLDAEEAWDGFLIEHPELDAS